MVNILLEGFHADAGWLMPELKKYIKPGMKVAIVALSFRDSQACDIDGWNALYSRDGGMYYGGMVNALCAYGIREDDIAFVNYFADSHDTAAAKIAAADILYFPGGLPDRMMERITEMGLYDIIAAHKGVAMGFSAGAVIQMKEYHLSPDSDYPEFAYYRGFPWLEGFYLEVHYEGNDVQKECISRVLREKKCPVYATEFMKGAMIFEDGRLRLVGDVKLFE